MSDDQWEKGRGRLYEVGGGAGMRRRVEKRARKGKSERERKRKEGSKECGKIRWMNRFLYL